MAVSRNSMHQAQVTQLSLLRMPFAGILSPNLQATTVEKFRLRDGNYRLSGWAAISLDHIHVIVP